MRDMNLSMADIEADDCSLTSPELVLAFVVCLAFMGGVAALVGLTVGLFMGAL